MSKFKIGDWITTSISKIPVRVDEITLSQLATNPSYYSAKPWQPKQGEWVVIHPYPPEMNKPTSFTIRQYDKIWKTKAKIEPFIGKLPSFIKEN